MKPTLLRSVKEDLFHWTGCCLCGKKMLHLFSSVGVACADLRVSVVKLLFLGSNLNFSAVLGQRGPIRTTQDSLSNEKGPF